MLMSWERSLLNRAITEWGDESKLAVAKLLSSSAVDSVASLIAASDEAGWREALFERDGFVATRIDAEMNRRAVPALTHAIDLAAGKLCQIHPSLRPIADNLRLAILVTLPKPPDLLTTPAPPEQRQGKSWMPQLALPQTFKTWKPPEAGLAWADKVANLAQSALATGASGLKDAAGVPDRLRISALRYLSDSWLSVNGEQAALARIFVVFNVSAAKARSTVR